MPFFHVLRVVAGILALVTVLAAGPAFATNGDYTVDNVAAQATGRSPLSARNAAIAKGQRDALASLLRRLAGADKAPAVTDQMVFQALEGFEVNGEKTTATSYSATLTVTFHRDVVDQMLTDQGVSFIAPSGHPAVIVPVLVGPDGKALLWGGGNPWAVAWAQRQPAADAALPLTVPQGDLPDIQAISADAAAALDPSALQALARNYQADTIIVAIANRSADGHYKIVVNWLGKGIIYQGTSAANGLDAAVTAVAQAIETVYTKTAQVPATQPQSLTAKVAFNGLSDWHRVKTVFETTPMIASVVIQTLSVGEAVVTINYQGDPDSLAGALAIQGLTMTKGRNGWILTTNGIGGQLRPVAAP